MGGWQAHQGGKSGVGRGVGQNENCRVGVRQDGPKGWSGGLKADLNHLERQSQGGTGGRVWRQAQKAPL